MGPKSKTVEIAFSLPMVADTVSSISHYSAPLYPYLDSASSKLSPVLDSGYSSLKTGMEKRLPEGVNDTITHVKVQASSLTSRLDSSLLSYLELLLAKLPVLKEPTLAIMTSATEQANTAVTFVASFALTQLVIKASVLGLETTDSLLKLVDREEIKPVQEGLRKIQAGVIRIGKEGVIRNGSEKVQSLKDVTLVEAAATVLGLDYVFSLLGLQGLFTELEVKEQEAAGQEAREKDEGMGEE